MYINCKTNFSFHYGTYFTEDLVKEAAAAGIAALALTNINNTCDLWDFADFCGKHGVKPIAGAEIKNEDRLEYILLAKNNTGLAAINQFLTQHLSDKTAFPPRPSLEEVYVIYPFGKRPLNTLAADEYVGVQSIDLNKLFGLSVQVYAHKLVAWQPVTFRDKQQYNVHRLLRAIDKNILLSKQDKKDLAGEHETMRPPSLLKEQFREYPDLIANACRLLDNCAVTIDKQTIKTKQVFSEARETDKATLRRLAYDGMQERYGQTNEEARERIAKELQIIDDLGYNAYYLIVHDVIQYANAEGFFMLAAEAAPTHLLPTACESPTLTRWRSDSTSNVF